LHQSLPKCHETLKRFASWKTISSGMEREIRKCDVCGRSRKWPIAKHGPLPNWYASRLIVLPLKDRSALTVAQVLIEHVYLTSRPCGDRSR
jgi:hypothetical protein